MLAASQRLPSACEIGGIISSLLRAALSHSPSPPSVPVTDQEVRVGHSNPVVVATDQSHHPWLLQLALGTREETRTGSQGPTGPDLLKDGNLSCIW